MANGWVDLILRLFSSPTVAIAATFWFNRSTVTCMGLFLLLVYAVACYMNSIFGENFYQIILSQSFFVIFHCHSNIHRTLRTKYNIIFHSIHVKIWSCGEEKKERNNFWQRGHIELRFISNPLTRFYFYAHSPLIWMLRCLGAIAFKFFTISYIFHKRQMSKPSEFIHMKIANECCAFITQDVRYQQQMGCDWRKRIESWHFIWKRENVRNSARTRKGERAIKRERKEANKV